MKNLFIIALLAVSFNFLLSSNTLFSMEEKKEIIRKLIRSRSCPELSVLKYNKKVRINKDKELWASISFLGHRLNTAEKEQRSLTYDMQQTRYLVLALFNQSNAINEELIIAQNSIMQLQGTVQTLLEDKGRRLELKTLKKRKKSKDDSNGTSSLVNSLPFPDEPIVKEKPSDENLFI